MNQSLLNWWINSVMWDWPTGLVGHNSSNVLMWTPKWHYPLFLISFSFSSYLFGACHPIHILPPHLFWLMGMAFIFVKTWLLASWKEIATNCVCIYGKDNVYSNFISQRKNSIKRVDGVDHIPSMPTCFASKV